AKGSQRDRGRSSRKRQGRQGEPSLKTLFHSLSDLSGLCVRPSARLLSAVVFIVSIVLLRLTGRRVGRRGVGNARVRIKRRQSVRLGRLMIALRIIVMRRLPRRNSLVRRAGLSRRGLGAASRRVHLAALMGL